MFPNDLPDFLVLKNLYDTALLKYELVKAENKLID